VRLALASQPDLPEDVIERLAGDRSWRVRHTLVRRCPVLPERVLTRLRADRDHRVANVAAGRESVYVEPEPDEFTRMVRRSLQLGRELRRQQRLTEAG
jgi:hypothetical protein